LHVDDENELENINKEIMDRINASGEFFIAGTKIRGRYFLRVAIGNAATSGRHIERLRNLLQSALP
jgi:aromatic-L-amino-acid decarboxylase